MNTEPRYLISACLCGQPCRYDAGAFDFPALRRLAEKGAAIPFCPECAGGLPTPRTPCERCGDRVISRDGEDRTAEYQAGAAAALALCQQYGLRAAILKEGSPSCGISRIRDGSHTGRKIPGRGLTAELLAQHGMALYSEERLPEELASE